MPFDFLTPKDGRRRKGHMSQTFNHLASMTPRLHLEEVHRLARLQYFVPYRKQQREINASELSGSRERLPVLVQSGQPLRLLG